jgi:D-alanyl-D-alanine carboxypeptidase/D-alanyl-D-alanine-endopeptidase (penicillin-binding protein 4)
MKLTQLTILRFLIFLMTFVKLPFSGISQNHKSKDWKTLESTISNKISKDSLLSSSHFSLQIKNLSNGKSCLAINPNMASIPASNLKLLSTMAGLDVLGKNFKFETKVLYSGDIQNNVLKGNIYIVGSGDPTLESKRFEKNQFINSLIKALQQKEIKSIQGNIVACMGESDVQTIPNQWTWGDIGNYYGAACYSINYAENMFQISFAINDSNQYTSIENTQPPLPWLSIQNKVLKGKKGIGDKSVIYSSPFHNQIKAIGYIYPKQNKPQINVKAAMPNPAQALSYAIKSTLDLHQISVTGIDTFQFFSSKELVDIQKNKTLYFHQSVELHEIVEQTNLYSINLFAEAIYKKTGYQLFKTFDYDSLKVNFKKYWTQKNIDTKGINLTDGCGLSMSNTLTTNQMCDAIMWASHQTWFNDWKNSLPKAGVSGTLQSFTANVLLQNSFQAKTGTLNRITCYSGILKINQQEYSFSLMINFYDGKPADVQKKVENILLQILEQ